MRRNVVVVLILMAVLVAFLTLRITLKYFSFKDATATKDGVEVKVRMIGKDNTAGKTTIIGSPYSLIVGLRPEDVRPFKAILKEVIITDKKEQQLYKNNNETVEEGTMFSDGTINAVFTINPVNLEYLDHKTCIKYRIITDVTTDKAVCLDIEKSYSERRSFTFLEIMSGA